MLLFPILCHLIENLFFPLNNEGKSIQSASSPIISGFKAGYFLALNSTFKGSASSGMPIFLANTLFSLFGISGYWKT